MTAPAPHSQPDIVTRLRAAERGDWRVTAVASICGDAADEIAALKSRVEELTKALEWQPIEAAPDGVVLLYFPRKEGRNAHGEMVQAGRVSAYPFRPPTHWMPLPGAPSMSLEDRK